MRLPSTLSVDPLKPPGSGAAVFSCPTVCYCTATGSLDGRRHFSPPGLAEAGLFIFGAPLARCLRRSGIPPRDSLNPAGTAARGISVRSDGHRLSRHIGTRCFGQFLKAVVTGGLSGRFERSIRCFSLSCP